MILLTCSCLNIQIHCKGNTLKILDASEVKPPENILNDSFFSSKVYLCVLDLAGVTMSQQRLCKERLLEGWSVTTCICCTMEVFAKCMDDNDKVYVNSQAQTDPAYISSLMESENYSPLFKLVLPEINDNFIQNIGVEIYNGNIDGSIEVVQSQVSNYLKDEQKAMEARLRQFNEQQEAQYTNLLSKVKKHKQAMVYLMFKGRNKENSRDDSSAESSMGSPPVIVRDSANESSASTDSAFDRSETTELSATTIVKQQKVISLRRTVSNPSRRTKANRELRRAPASIDVGGVFDMEEFDTKEESFSAVSDSESEESESETSSDVGQKKCEDFPIYGSSLPMSIPNFTHIPRYPMLEDDEKDSPPKAPADIAASIRALACSVSDGTEMFGELPRRRLNTGELLSSRPF